MNNKPFTDEDLKEYKERAIRLDRQHTMALLARLEAESWCAGLLEVHYESGVFDDLDEEDVALIVQALDARRKASGRI